MLLLVEVQLAVFELRYANRNGFRALARHLLDRLQFFAQFLRVFDLLNKLFGRLLVAMQQVGHNIANSRNQRAPNLAVAKFVLGLRLEDWVFQPNGHRGEETFAHIVAIELGFAELVDAFENPLAKGAQVCAPIGRELTVDEGVILLAEAIGMGEGKIERFIAVVKGWIDLFVEAFFLDKVQQASFGDKLAVIEVDLEPSVQIGIETQSTRKMIIEKLVIAGSGLNST